MTIKFTKKVTNEVLTTDVKTKDQTRTWRLFDGQGILAGEFVLTHEKQFFRLGDRFVHVQGRKHHLVDAANEQIGMFMPDGNSLFSKEPPVTGDPYMKIMDKIYLFNQLPSDVSWNILKADTYGHYKFGIRALRGQDFATYSLKIDLPAWHRLPINYFPLDGTIETNMDDMLVILSTFYMIELWFEEKGNE